MRYKIIVSRFQTAERHIRAADEETAIRTIQAELDRPYGMFATWSTVGTDINIVGVESTSPELTNQQIRDVEGSYLLSVKQAAKYLGVSISMMYEAVRSGDIAHVSFGSRRYVSRARSTTTSRRTRWSDTRTGDATGRPNHHLRP